MAHMKGTDYHGGNNVETCYLRELICRMKDNFKMGVR
jgi:hypothetical protein